MTHLFAPLFSCRLCACIRVTSLAPAHTGSTLVLLVAVLATVHAAKSKKKSSKPTKLDVAPELLALYKSRADKCDFFVSPQGKNSSPGTDIAAPFKTLSCAINPDCNQALEASAATSFFLRC